MRSIEIVDDLFLNRTLFNAYKPHFDSEWFGVNENLPLFGAYTSYFRGGDFAITQQEQLVRSRRHRY